MGLLGESGGGGAFKVKVEAAFQALGVEGFLIRKGQTRLFFDFSSCRSKGFFAPLRVAFREGPDPANAAFDKEVLDFFVGRGGGGENPSKASSSGTSGSGSGGCGCGCDRDGLGIRHGHRG